MYLPPSKTFQGGKRTALYARVSFTHQHDELDEELHDLRSAYPGHTHVLSDVGSGLDFQRPGLQALLGLVFDKAIDQVVVAYPDRLGRLTVDLLETIFHNFGVELVVHNCTQESPEKYEVAQDLLTILRQAHGCSNK